MNTFVASIDLTLSEKLRSDLIDQGFVLTTPPYTIFSAQKKGVSCTLYTSGKLTVQGKDKDDFIAFYLEPEILKTLAYTHPEITVDMTARIGSDEAGKGDVFGPLCIASVYADQKGIEMLLKMGVCDSKRLTDTTVLDKAKQIRHAFQHAIVRLPPIKYNELYHSFHNLNYLLAWGHGVAVSELIEKTQCTHVLIDQFARQPLVAMALKKKHIEAQVTQRPRAEEDPVVAAASILARAAFLEGLRKLSEEFSFDLPKGANSNVIVAGKKFVTEHGKESLRFVSKLHFKTIQSMESP